MPVLTPVVEGQSVLNLEVGGSSSAGIKAVNGDAFAVNLPASQSVRAIKGVAACMADGASCSDHAQLASQTAIAHFMSDYYSTPDTWGVKKSSSKVLNSLNSWLYHHQRFNGENAENLPHNKLLTTFSAIVFKSTTAHIFHVGDSRIYRLRQGSLEQLSQDHVFQQGKQAFLSRSLGMDSRLEVDYLQEDLQLGDIFILTSDGCHGFVSSKSFKQALEADNKDLERLAKRFVEEALAAGSEDNVSCLLIKLTQLPTLDIDEAHERLLSLRVPPALDLGQAIDQFEVKKALHSGSRSHVYLVTDRRSGKEYVLKAPSQNFAEDVVYLEAFAREEWVGRRLNHPSILKIYPRPDNSTFLYHLSEYVEGKSLRQWMYDNPRPDLEQVREVAKSIVQCLRVFQRKGMVHRDVKPENLVFDTNGNLKLIDFGAVQVDGLEEISQVIEETAPVGAKDYCAPEYLQSLKGMHCSDIFSLGVICYEMLTGQLPYGASTTMTKQYQGEYRSARQWRDDIPVWLDLALAKACHKLPGQRYQAMSEFLMDISKPSKVLMRHYEHSPLIAKNPLLVWQSVSALLFILLVLQFILSQ